MSIELRRPDKRVIEALAGLDGNTYWKEVHAWLSGSLSDLEARCVDETADIHLRQSQGAAQAIRQVLDRQKEAVEIKRSR